MLLALLTQAVGCASEGSPGLSVLRALVRGELQGPAASPHYQPQYRYLRAQLNDFPAAYLVLGFVDPHPDGPTETWYSANGEILVLRDGRIIATTGLATDWSQVQYATWPRWTEVGERPLLFSRIRDERPSYRFGIQEQLSLQQEPSTTAHPTPAAPIANARWLMEQTPQLPPAWYALSPSEGQLRWAYTYQCLKPGFCLSLQPWSPQANAP
ncbi:MAG: YjbF family lipoprotein [Rhodoferax sp.]